MSRRIEEEPTRWVVSTDTPAELDAPPELKALLAAAEREGTPFVDRAALRRRFRPSHNQILGLVAAGITLVLVALVLLTAVAASSSRDSAHQPRAHQP